MNKKITLASIIDKLLTAYPKKAPRRAVYRYSYNYEYSLPILNKEELVILTDAINANKLQVLELLNSHPIFKAQIATQEEIRASQYFKGAAASLTRYIRNENKAAQKRIRSQKRQEAQKAAQKRMAEERAIRKQKALKNAQKIRARRMREAAEKATLLKQLGLTEQQAKLVGKLIK